MTKAKGTAIETQYGYTDDRPDYLPDNSSKGQENVTVDDLTIPRLGLVQDLSPQRKKGKPEYIEGADSGMLFNNVTGELYGGSINFVPVYFRKEWCIWKLQSAGGGFFGAFDSEAEAQQAFTDNGYDSDYEIVDMAQHFGMVLHADRRPEEIVISMSKSKMKVNRQLNTLVKMAGGDRFSRVYKISAVEDQNKEGQDYYNFGVAPVGFVSEPVYNLATVMYESVSGGIKDVVRTPD
jgi:hypothetical protein